MSRQKGIAMCQVGILPQKENNLPKFKIRPVPVLSMTSVIVMSRQTKLYMRRGPIESKEKNRRTRQ